MNLTRVTLATASSVLLMATLAACGGSGSDDGSTATDPGASSQQGQQGQQGDGGRPGGMPGASGLVAAVSGRTAQVQGFSGQVAVSWTGETTFTQQVEGSLDDVTVGSCVMVTDADATDDANEQPTEQPTELAAASVRIISASSDDGCGFGGAGGPGGGVPGGGERPSGAPSDLPSDLPSMPEGGGMPGGGRGGFGTVGEVTAVSATGFTVSAMQRGAQEGSDPATTDVTVTVDDDTTYTTNAEATASAVKTGVCVTAQGQADDTGAVTADSVSVSKAVDGQCTGGLMGGGRPGGAA